MSRKRDVGDCEGKGRMVLFSFLLVVYCNSGWIRTRLLLFLFFHFWHAAVRVWVVLRRFCPFVLSSSSSLSLLPSIRTFLFRILKALLFPIAAPTTIYLG